MDVGPDDWWLATHHVITLSSSTYSHNMFFKYLIWQLEIFLQALNIFCTLIVTRSSWCWCVLASTTTAGEQQLQLFPAVSPAPSFLSEQLKHNFYPPAATLQTTKHDLFTTHHVFLLWFNLDFSCFYNHCFHFRVLTSFSFSRYVIIIFLAVLFNLTEFSRKGSILQSWEHWHEHCRDWTISL